MKNRWTHNEMFELYNFIQVNHDHYFSKKVLIIFGDILSDSGLKIVLNANLDDASL